MLEAALDQNQITISLFNEQVIAIHQNGDNLCVGWQFNNFAIFSRNLELHSSGIECFNFFDRKTTRCCWNLLDGCLGCFVGSDHDRLILTDIVGFGVKGSFK